MSGLLARKIEMTRVMQEDKFVPVTLLQIPMMQVIGYKTEKKDGYSAVVVGINKDATPVKLATGKQALNPREFAAVREFAIEQSQEGEKEIGSVVGCEMFDGVESVGLSGVSKGRGFAGAMKRHNFHGGPASHGSKFHRALGSIGNRKPVRTHKGKKMHGHYGVDRVSLRDVPLDLVNAQAGIIGVRGPVPGARNSLIEIYL